MFVANNHTVSLANETETLSLGAQIASNIVAPLIIWLQGDLGAGKTTFTRGLLNALGHNGAVKSPTYNIVESYPLQKFTLHHFDLYRFQTADEWQDAGLDELFTANSVSLIEWPQQGADFVPKPDIILHLTTIDHGRKAELTAFSDHGKHLIASIKN